MQSYGKINTECKCTILNKFFKEYIETSTSVLVRLTFLCLHGHAFTDFSFPPKIRLYIYIQMQ